jgi:uncharacterized phage protein (TIGR02218 family)
MRHIPLALQAKLDSRLTTLCTCHIVERKDGVRQGFTDHDRDIALDGVLCLASTGFSGSEMTEKLGFAISGGEVAGGLIDDSLSEDDILKGLYDGAIIHIWLVDWQEPTLKVLIRSGTIGEIIREGHSFKAEIRSSLAALDIEKGRAYIPSCDALVGDNRCKVSMVAWTVNGVVTTAHSPVDFEASGLTGFAANSFTQGKLTWVTGANAGASSEVHYSAGNMVVLRAEMTQAIVAGDTFIMKAGCDKTYATCKAKFMNGINFRGFPHIPGNDFMVSYPIPGDAGHDGSAL